MLKDPVKEIQDRIFRYMENFMEKLESISEKENLEHIENIENLENNNNQLNPKIQQNKEINLKIKKNNNIIRGMFFLEKPYHLLKYYKYKHSSQIVEKAKDSFDLKINLTGKL